jgi:CheY-like chemotaxis protein/signal transduction histidine kinase/HAMP domain-containing protein
MKKIAFASIRSNLTFWFLFLALSPLLIGMVITYTQSSKEFRETTFEKLSAIRDLKVMQLETWIAERVWDMNTMSRDSELLTFSTWLNDKNDPGNQKKKNIRAILENYQKSHSVYSEIFIINAKTGIVEISTNPIYEGQDKTGDSYFHEPLITNKIFIKDIYYSPTVGENSMTFSIPLHISSQKDSEIKGIIVARVDLKSSLYNLLLNRTGLGKTGETLIVNKNLFAISDLRWYQNAPLEFRLNTEAAMNAVQGKTGISITEDYRGEKVLVAYTFIHETGWGFVCKQDWSELSGPTNAMGQLLVLLFVVSGLVIMFIVYFVSKSISSPIVDLVTDSQNIADGNYSIRNSVRSHNELGQLGKAINTMVNSIESKAIVQKGSAIISEAVIGHTTRRQYVETFLRKMLTVTNANMAVFYTLNESGTEYEHFDSIGVHKNLMQPFMAKNPEGEISNALAMQKIQHLKNIPGNTKFMYKTSIGEIIPSEVVTIPVKNNKDTVIAIVSLAKIDSFTDEAIESINQSWNVLNTSYGNLLANERTAFLADNLLFSNQKLEAQTEELREQAEELQHQANELQKGSDVLQLQNQELEMQRIQVEEATRLKSEFLSNMSHELRTPLNSINALSHVLIRQAKHKLSPEENEYMEVIERNGKRLLSLINDILDLSKIEAGKMELQPKPLSLKDFLRQITDNIQPLARQKNITLAFTMADEDIKIDTDETRLYQIMSNIIGNAVKFTNKGGVEISVIPEKTVVHFHVKDSGIGISREAIPYIFDEFRQADGSTSRAYEGTGLGLAIAKKLVKALHGKISVESTLGEGSVFTVSLPVKWEGRLESEAFAINQNLTTDQSIKTILVVDDDPETVREISQSLHDGGYHTLGTTSGQEALELAVKYKPFAITLDIVMPEMDGFEVLQKIKNNPETSDIPVIIISVSDDQQTSFALGAVGYISKPVDRQALIREVRKLNPNPATIMIVDDNPVDRNQIKQILQQENLHNIEAESGMKCLEMLSLNQPDILVLDLMMPGMNGFQVLDEIRKRPETRDLPVIVVTAKDLTPYDKAQLTGKVATVLKKNTDVPARIFAEIKRILDQIKMNPTANRKPDGPVSVKRILIVEDNRIAVIQIKKILEREPITVDVATDGNHALEYMKHTIPDGVILDLMMPGIDGFEVLETIRGTEETRKIPVIVLTAKNLTKNDLSRLSSNNIQQLIQKGDINPHELLDKVRSMLHLNPLPDIAIEKIAVYQDVSYDPLKRTSPLTDRFKILVIEDNADNRLTLRAIIGESYLLVEATDGEDGLQKIFSELPDLVLLDISLPKMNGFEVVALLKKDEKTKRIPVIALTARAMKNDREEILAAGCDEYVAKPVDRDELLLKIEHLLQKHQS